MQPPRGPVVLFSGGLDSLACIAHYKALSAEPRALFVDYGQRARIREAACAAALASSLDCPLDIVAISGIRPSAGFISGRNGLLLMTALTHANGHGGIVSIGVHRGTDYPDCTARFIKEMQDIFDLYTGGTLQIDAPFLEWTKLDIWNFLCREKLPVNATYSCEAGDTPCGSCLSCLDVRELHAR